LRNNVTVPLEARSDALGNIGNTLIFGPGGGTLVMHSTVGGTSWGNPVVVNGDATFLDASTNGTDTFGSLTINTASVIHHYLPTGLNFIDPRLNFGNTALNSNATFNIDRPPIAGDYGRLTISNVREFNGPKSITKLGEGILNIAGSAGFTGDLNVSEGLVIIPDSVPTLSGISGEGQVIGSVNIRAGGHVDPGLNGVGTLIISEIALNGAAANKVQLDMEGDATGFDRLFVADANKLHLNGEAVFNLTSLGGVTAGDYTLIDYPGNPISDVDFQKLSLATPIFAGFNASLVNDPVTTQIKLRLEGAPPPQWNIDADGNWNNLANWEPSLIPDAPTASANFLGKITAPRTITLDGSRSVAQLNISNTNTYTIASDGAGSSLTLGSDVNNAIINVGMGSHVISAPVVMSGNVLMNITGGTALNMSGGLSIAAGKTATMTSSGSLQIGGPQNHGAGSTLNMASGHVTLNSNMGAAATAATAANAGLAIRISGDASVVLNSDQDLASIRVDFDQAGDQSFDLASPAGPGQYRSVRVYASDLASAKTSLYGAMVTANAANASSHTDGIFDSGLAIHFGMKLGIAQLTDAYGDSYLLMRPTRTGDLNLDGVVSISDFIDLASNFGASNATWQEGDLNYDGQVSISDFIDLASNFNGSYAGSIGPVSAQDQQTLASFASSLGVDPAIIGSAVPEPGMIGLLGGAAITLSGRRRRK
jgi:autotransporter-associated beta strand protein